VGPGFAAFLFAPFGGRHSTRRPVFLLKNRLQRVDNSNYNVVSLRGCSSVVERHVANVDVVSSSLITRFEIYSVGELPAK
jgi:hypothetical protein